MKNGENQMNHTLKRVMALLLCAVMLSCGVLAEDAKINPDEYTSRYPEAVERMLFTGILKGSDKGLQLEKTLTRAEAAVLLVRVMGADAELLDTDVPFTDVPEWALPFVAYLYTAGAVKGMSATNFGSQETVTAQQFCTMLLRALGYSDKSGDFTYKNALGFAVKIGMITAEDADEMKTTFVRDDAAYLCCAALNHNGRNGKEPYAIRKAGELSNSYRISEAQVMTGTNEVYNRLKAASKALAALDSYKITQKAVYTYRGKTVDRRETLNTTVYVAPTVGASLYDIKLVEKSFSKVTREQRVYTYTDGSYMALYSSDTGKWIGSDSADPALMRRCRNIFDTLFAPDTTYIRNFDVSVKDGIVTLSGYHFRLELLADMTGDIDMQYYFDMVIRLDAKTNLPISVSCSYADKWEINGKPADVVYKVEYTFDGFNETELPMTVMGLEEFLKQR